MQKLLAVAVVAVLATAAINVVVFRRQRDLSEQVATLRRQVEARPSPGVGSTGTTGTAEPRVAESDRPIEGAVPAAGDGGSQRVPSSAGGMDAAGTPAFKGRATGAPDGAAIAQLSEPMRAAIAQEVDRLMKDKGPGMQVLRPAEQLAFLAKELNLSETQKLRIKDIWRARDQEVRKMMEDNDGFPGPKKFNELQERYHALVRNELDGAQQMKFDDMKKEGTLPTGAVTVRVEHRDEGEEPPK